MTANWKLSHIVGCSRPLYMQKGNEIIILTPKENTVEKYYQFTEPHPERDDQELTWNLLIEYLNYVPEPN